jgi:hypothetical protein
MSHFEFDPSYIHEGLYLERGIEEIITDRGEAALTRAKEHASEHSETGAWEEGMEGGFHRGANNHPYYRVENSSEGALSIEFGTHHNPAHRDLGRAIDSISGE